MADVMAKAVSTCVTRWYRNMMLCTGFSIAARTSLRAANSIKKTVAFTIALPATTLAQEGSPS